VPLPESIEAGLADGTYTYAYEPPPTWGMDGNGEWCNVGFYVPYEYHRDFVRQALGVSSAGGGGASWDITGPKECPVEGAEGMYAFGYDARPMGELITNDVGDPIRFSDALVTVQYRTPFFNWGAYEDPFFLQSISPDAAENQLLLWATQEVETHSQTYRLSNRERIWLDGDEAGEPVTEAGRQASVDVPYHDVVITFNRVPFLPRRLAYFTDKLNWDEFLGFGRGEVWFRGYRTQLRSWVGGVRTRGVQLQFSIRPEIDWNKFLDERLLWNRAGAEVPTAAANYHEDLGDAGTWFRVPKSYCDMKQVLQLQFLASSVPIITGA
jgi:hypothetical protein